jgi:DNA replication protein DnaC
LANFNLKRQPPKVALLTQSLIEGEVLDRCDNVRAFGNSGSGKTHLLCVIGQELIARGRRMYFTTSALLVQDLSVAKRVIDDLGYVQQSREEMELLFTLLAERY